MRQNCWELKKCGKEPNGMRSAQLGVCPAAIETRLDGTHGGQNSGRACWVIGGTLCNKSVQGSYSEKYIKCYECEVYGIIKKEEGNAFQLSPTLLKKIQV